MYLLGSHHQTLRTHIYDASGSITSGGTAQLVLPDQMNRSSLLFINNSSSNMFLEIGYARAGLPVLSNGTIASVPMTGTNANVGFGYSRAPLIVFRGGAFLQTGVSYSTQGTIDYNAPSNPAKAHCVMTGAAGSMTVSSIVVDNPGSGYMYPPVCYLGNDPLDPFGAAVPSATVGILLVANGGSYVANGTVCSTDPVSIFCAASSAAFTCKYTL